MTPPPYLCAPHARRTILRQLIKEAIERMGEKGL